MLDIQAPAGADAAAELRLRLAVDDLVSDYVHAIDDGALDRWPEFFTEDGTYKLITRDNYDDGLTLGLMYCAGRGMMRDRIRALESANIYEPHTYCHLLGKTRVEGAADGVVKARTNFTVVRTMQSGEDKRFAVGKYLDECAVVDGRLLLKSRLVVLESRRVDVLLAYPL